MHYVYGMGGLLYGEYDGSGALIREYIYLNGEPIAQIDNVSSSDVLTYLHTDHLGTPRAASDSTGASVWSWDSDAFGNGAPTGTQTVNLRFAGQYWDDESGLHYNWNRYYDPTTGRYISSDPIGLNGGLNTFAYVSANPVMFIDPEGLKSVSRNGRASRGERNRIRSHHGGQARREAKKRAQAIKELLEVQKGRKLTQAEYQQLVNQIYENLLKIIAEASARGDLYVCLEKECDEFGIKSCPMNEDTGQALTELNSDPWDVLDSLRCTCKVGIYLN
ncbi:MAG: RHS repeat-associated core domain-containing protein [Alphaproteobacteria bacterium]